MQKQIQSPEKMISDAGLELKDLGSKGKKLMQLYEETLQLQQKFPDDPSIGKTADSTLLEITKTVKSLIAQTKPNPDKSKPAKALHNKKPPCPCPKKAKQSSQVMKGLEELEMAELDVCRVKLREYRKVQSSNRPKRAPKTRIVKLKERLLALAKLMPKPMRKDDKAMQETEKILLAALSKLKKVWELNRVKAIENAIKEELKTDK